MLQSLFDIIYGLLDSENFNGMVNNFGVQDDVALLIVLTSCVLICLTVAFVFKFILKLVDR